MAVGGAVAGVGLLAVGGTVGLGVAAVGGAVGLAGFAGAWVVDKVGHVAAHGINLAGRLERVHARRACVHAHLPVSGWWAGSAVSPPTGSTSRGSQ